MEGKEKSQKGTLSLDSLNTSLSIPAKGIIKSTV